MKRIAVALALSAVAPNLLASTPDVLTSNQTEGVEALCAKVAEAAKPNVAGAGAIRLQLSAEGAALEVAEVAESRCAALVHANAKPPGAGDRVVRVRLRVAGTLFAATVDVLDANQAVLATTAVEAPLGAALGTWLSAAGGGIETWLVGETNDRVLALCGDDPAGDGAPLVAMLTPTSLAVVRWSVAGLSPVATMKLPPELAPHARTPGATLVCRAKDGALDLAFGVTDRNRGGAVLLSGGAFGKLALLDGVPVALPATGAPTVAEGVPGTDLLRWNKRVLAALALDGDEVAGTTEDGAPLDGDVLGAPMSSGVAATLADLDGDGTPEHVRTLPVWAGANRSDRLVAGPRLESAPLHGVVEALGTVRSAGASRVVAVLVDARGSRLVAFGRRRPTLQVAR